MEIPESPFIGKGMGPAVHAVPQSTPEREATPVQYVLRAAPESTEREKKGFEKMTDRDPLALADAVGVLDPNTQYLRQLERIHRHQQRVDYFKGGIVFAALVAAVFVFALHVGTP